MTESDPRYRILSATVEGKLLRVDWADGHRSEFHALWLRHQCYCDSCGTPVNALRNLRLHHLPEDLQPRLHSLTAGAIELDWANDGHRSVYAAPWLRDHCYSASERAQRKHRPSLWDSGIRDDCPSADLVECEQSPGARLVMLESLRDYGFCLIRNAPQDAAEASRLINLVGPQRQSHYGTYNLSNKGAVDNVGDVTTALDPHCDETYRLSTIGITVFQVLRPSRSGGHSTLVDGFEAVRRLRAESPGDFDLLTRLPITATRRDTAYNSGGQTKWYAATMPVIRVDYDGDVCGLRCNERQIMPLEVAADLVEPAYRALKHLFRILYDPELCLTFALKAGEGLLFNNQRVLHGRTAYAAENPPRSVLTSSVDLEEFHSSLRLLSESERGSVPPLRLAPGMVV